MDRSCKSKEIQSISNVRFTLTHTDHSTSPSIYATFSGLGASGDCSSTFIDHPAWLTFAPGELFTVTNNGLKVTTAPFVVQQPSDQASISSSPPFPAIPTQVKELGPLFAKCQSPFLGQAGVVGSSSGTCSFCKQFESEPSHRKSGNGDVAGGPSYHVLPVDDNGLVPDGSLADHSGDKRPAHDPAIGRLFEYSDSTTSSYPSSSTWIASLFQASNIINPATETVPSAGPQSEPAIVAPSSTLDRTSPMEPTGNDRGGRQGGGGTGGGTGAESGGEGGGVKGTHGHNFQNVAFVSPSTQKSLPSDTVTPILQTAPADINKAFVSPGLPEQPDRPTGDTPKSISNPHSLSPVDLAAVAKALQPEYPAQKNPGPSIQPGRSPDTRLPTGSGEESPAVHNENSKYTAMPANSPSQEDDWPVPVPTRTNNFPHLSGSEPSIVQASPGGLIAASLDKPPLVDENRNTPPLAKVIAGSIGTSWMPVALGDHDISALPPAVQAKVGYATQGDGKAQAVSLDDVLLTRAGAAVTIKKVDAAGSSVPLTLSLDTQNRLFYNSMIATLKVPSSPAAATNIPSPDELSHDQIQSIDGAELLATVPSATGQQFAAVTGDVTGGRNDAGSFATDSAIHTSILGDQPLVVLPDGRGISIGGTTLALNPSWIPHGTEAIPERPKMTISGTEVALLGNSALLIDGHSTISLPSGRLVSAVNSVLVVAGTHSAFLPGEVMTESGYSALVINGNRTVSLPADLATASKGSAFVVDGSSTIFLPQEQDYFTEDSALVVDGTYTTRVPDRIVTTSGQLKLVVGGSRTLLLPSNLPTDAVGSAFIVDGTSTIYLQPEQTSNAEDSVLIENSSQSTILPARVLTEDGHSALVINGSSTVLLPSSLPVTAGGSAFVIDGNNTIFLRPHEASRADLTVADAPTTASQETSANGGGFLASSFPASNTWMTSGTNTSSALPISSKRPKNQGCDAVKPPLAIFVTLLLGTLIWNLGFLTRSWDASWQNSDIDHTPAVLSRLALRNGAIS